MPRARSKRSNKYFQLQSDKIKRAQRLLRTKTAMETIDRALDFVIAEARRNALARKANQRFIQTAITIRDVFGALD
jgi:hypothetical protein